MHVKDKKSNSLHKLVFIFLSFLIKKEANSHIKCVSLKKYSNVTFAWIILEKNYHFNFSDWQIFLEKEILKYKNIYNSFEFQAESKFYRYN